MLLVMNRPQGANYISLRILSIETGEELREFRQLVKAKLKIDIIEQFNEKLLLKQEGTPLHIVDLLTGSVVKVSNTQFKTPSAFIFLYENQTFLAFKDNVVTVWNFRGELVSTFDDHALWFPLPEIDHTSVIYITQSQDVIISLCEDHPDRCAPHPPPPPLPRARDHPPRLARAARRHPPPRANADARSLGHRLAQGGRRGGAAGRARVDPRVQHHDGKVPRKDRLEARGRRPVPRDRAVPQRGDGRHHHGQRAGPAADLVAVSASVLCGHAAVAPRRVGRVSGGGGERGRGYRYRH